jgi:CRP-like cAMP-binding protein
LADLFVREAQEIDEVPMIKTPAKILLRKLASLGPLDHEDIRAVGALRFRTQDLPKGQLLVREGDVVRECCLLIEGYAYRQTRTADGARKIVSFHLPGDLLNVQHLQLPKAESNVETISACKIAWVPSADLRALLNERPHINDALWRHALVDASIFREWMLNVCRRPAVARIAHMACEFAARWQAAGLGGLERLELPMSRDQIADATGLTVVLVNRLLQDLISAGVIKENRGHICIIDWEQMRELANFDPGYLYQAA